MCSLCNRYQESEPRGINKSPFSLCDCLCSDIFAIGASGVRSDQVVADFKGGLHHAEVSDRSGCILCDAERCRRCRSASQGATASGTCSGWQVSGRQVSNWQISASAARRDQRLTVWVLDARKIERPGYASHYHSYEMPPLRRGISSTGIAKEMGRIGGLGPPSVSSAYASVPASPPYLPSRSQPRNSSTACLAFFSRRFASPSGLSASPPPIAEL
jgi:hypothetical protein